MYVCPECYKICDGPVELVRHMDSCGSSPESSIRRLMCVGIIHPEEEEEVRTAIFGINNPTHHNTKEQ